MYDAHFNSYCPLLTAIQMLLYYGHRKHPLIQTVERRLWDVIKRIGRGDADILHLLLEAVQSVDSLVKSSDLDLVPGWFFGESLIIFSYPSRLDGA